jgi:hypothetical protein
MKCRRGRKRIYSEKLDACIQVETKLFGPSVQVRDLTQTVITDGISIYGALLLHCDIDGVDRVKIDVVRELRGFNEGIRPIARPCGGASTIAISRHPQYCPQAAAIETDRRHKGPPA